MVLAIVVELQQLPMVDHKQAHQQEVQLGLLGKLVDQVLMQMGNQAYLVPDSQTLMEMVMLQVVEAVVLALLHLELLLVLLVEQLLHHKMVVQLIVEVKDQVQLLQLPLVVQVAMDQGEVVVLLALVDVLQVVQRMPITYAIKLLISIYLLYHKILVPQVKSSFP